ncbi:uncharacterized protein LOC120326448 [Styela clava]|uniref:nucleolar protein 12-like n=1 Tax=Styela clava TaxID=7725 RepID=UPI00193A5B4B|nr:nucleolar protein 12-like [Styela clava]
MTPKLKKQKLELVFDTKERETFLTGFSKRKQARKKAAVANAEKQYRDEVARIRKEKRERIKQRLEEVASVRRANGMELAQLVRNETENEKILDLPQHIVTITSTEEMDLTKCEDNVYLGSNSNSNFVEIVDTQTNEDEPDNESEKPVKNKLLKTSNENKVEPNRKKSVSRVAEFARKTQMLKTKRRNRKHTTETGRMSKSQKKFLKRRSKHKSKSSQ